jgi:hypothetical protein
VPESVIHRMAASTDQIYSPGSSAPAWMRTHRVVMDGSLPLYD